MRHNVSCDIYVFAIVRTITLHKLDICRLYTLTVNMFAFECKLSKDGSVKEKIAGILKRLGAVQLLLGVVLAIASFAAIDIDKSNMVVMEAYNKTISAKVLLGLDAGSAVSSIWVRKAIVLQIQNIFII